MGLAGELEMIDTDKAVSYSCRKHEKVYDNTTILTTHPARMLWICRVCLEEGTEIIKLLNSEDEYAILQKRKFEVIR